MKNQAKGFTLVELMITIAIIAILTSVVLPNFSNYLTRSKISQLVTYAAPIKFKVGSAIATNSSTLLADAHSTASSTTAPYVGSIAVSGTGVITVTSSNSSSLSSDAQGKTIIFTPSPLFGSNATGLTSVTWTCAVGTMPVKYLGTCE